MLKSINNNRARFNDLYIKVDKDTSLTEIGIWDNDFETFTVRDLITIRSHLNKIIRDLLFKKKK